jgi:hypothetical protein
VENDNPPPTYDSALLKFKVVWTILPGEARLYNIHSS